MSDRALLVGINRYPDAPLAGCVNDVVDMAEFLVKSCAFKQDAVRLLTDQRATTDAIKGRLAWLVRDARPGDRLFFQFSGHGVQMPARNDLGEVDKLDEAVCPVTFDWTDQHALRDDFFSLAFKKLPAGVQFIWVSDSCHSGNLTRGMARPSLARTRSLGPRTMPIPADIAWRAQTAQAKGLKTKRFVHVDDQFPGVLISGCRQDETSADAQFRGRPNGALTYLLLRALQADRTRAIVGAVEQARRDLARLGYKQHPQVEGSRAIMDGPFF